MEMATDSEKAWYAVRTKPRHEKAVAKALQALGHECFLPLRRECRKWSDRVRTTEFPLFPAYVFCRFCWERRLPILTTPGVVSIVNFGSKPAPVDPAEIVSLQKAIASGMFLRAQSFLVPGARVRIERGALEGVEGILSAHKNIHRLIINITLLHRSVAVEIDRESISEVLR